MTKKWKIKKAQIFVSPKDYKIDGKIYYRVTTTLGVLAKHGLLNWAKSKGHAQAKKIMETRQAIGTHVHKLIELNLKGKSVNLGAYEQEIQDGLLLFDLFKKAARLKPQALEQSLWSNKHGYAGTADYVGYYTSPEEYLRATIVDHKRVKVLKFKKSSLMIGDWKTGKDVYPEYWLQVAAYAKAFEELTKVKVDGGFICRIRDGKLQVLEKTIEELEAEFPAYLSAVDLYEWRYKLGKYGFLRIRK